MNVKVEVLLNFLTKAS